MVGKQAAKAQNQVGNSDFGKKVVEGIAEEIPENSTLGFELGNVNFTRASDKCCEFLEKKIL